VGLVGEVRLSKGSIFELQNQQRVLPK
jgi:hypothetical protein